ncbi:MULTISPECIES: polysaccharide ABC transporter ATP-binding protein [Croceibacter]|uniref:ABC transporter ATP-binding protein n=1 Tax=Croceibacter TaxID=216431 RepID=UPI000C44030A|nr:MULTISPECIES: ABC transporter ATP-binding protein [Croceibacter]MBG26609.1 ABC transporter ATP-binding protein [Croceibacter sp.]|tara:strand:+ start:1301 stop:2539 length:1239 start_codon:yes stop_codon:yes gene_type:complete
MSQQTILKVENISKQYRLGNVGTGTLSHDLNRWWHQIRGKENPYAKVGAVNDRSATATQDYVWAIKNINFEVKKGEVLGIIGKNGAGKSTLLKILSRVTSPTTGSIKTKGRIASLLEVGTGFHPELTGKENIYLNGAILGMNKAEINSKIDEIIEFSGCQMYIDTPVKRYSSGMRVRLAFAVAAFLEPDILVIDEVLAVGDAEFQKKAIGKMQDISKGDGRTVIFVSHNMAAIEELCTRCILLKDGYVIEEGNTSKIVKHYLNLTQELSTTKINFKSNSLFKSINLLNNNTTISSGDALNIKVVFDENKLKNVTLGYTLKNEHERVIGASNMYQHRLSFEVDTINFVIIKITNINLNPGYYSMSFYIGDEIRDLESVQDAIGFNISWDNHKNLKAPMGHWGNLHIDTEWIYK